MAQTTMTFRVDDTLKKNFDELCDEFGLTSTAALTVFMKAVVRERRIPFDIRTKPLDTHGFLNTYESFRICCKIMPAAKLNEILAHYKKSLPLHLQPPFTGTPFFSYSMKLSFNVL